MQFAIWLYSEEVRIKWHIFRVSLLAWIACLNGKPHWLESLHGYCSLKANNPTINQSKTATNDWINELTLKVSMNFSSSSGGKKSPMWCFPFDISVNFSAQSEETKMYVINQRKTTSDSNNSYDLPATNSEDICAQNIIRKIPLCHLYFTFSGSHLGLYFTFSSSHFGLSLTFGSSHLGHSLLVFPGSSLGVLVWVVFVLGFHVDADLEQRRLRLHRLLLRRQEVVDGVHLQTRVGDFNVVYVVCINTRNIGPTRTQWLTQGMGMYSNPLAQS